MIVPFSKGKSGPPQGEPPSEAMMLMALAHMKEIGRIPPGPETYEEKAQGLLKQFPQRKPGPIDRNLNPGEPVPDRELGYPGGRDVRGI